ncbi:uncharacterized protein DEA37_0004099 [Paragonimus westermani]|uniref:Uncharacterized protein n=1 Tax=Paragonimus westermani TaxID=34504 RepID=A0A5J4N9X3_9TREM|nr:uncharacterized protein DEA37_0004099 [Paragonimus westermani]
MILFRLLRRPVAGIITGVLAKLSDIDCSASWSLTTCRSPDQRRAHGNFDHFRFDDLDEATCRKRIILPVVSLLRAPTLSRRLRNRIKSLLHKQGVSSCSTLNRLDLLAPSSVALNPVTTTDAGERIENDAGRDSCCRPEEPFITTADKAHRSDDDFAIPSYTDSATFLKGTQSANPHNDYSQHSVDTVERSQNFIRDAGLRNRFEEYRKLRELIRLKVGLIQSKVTPPMYLRADERCCV